MGALPGHCAAGPRGSVPSSSQLWSSLVTPRTSGIRQSLLKLSLHHIGAQLTTVRRRCQVSGQGRQLASAFRSRSPRLWAFWLAPASFPAQPAVQLCASAIACSSEACAPNDVVHKPSSLTPSVFGRGLPQCCASDLRGFAPFVSPSSQSQLWSLWLPQHLLSPAVSLTAHRPGPQVADSGLCVCHRHLLTGEHLPLQQAAGPRDLRRGWQGRVCLYMVRPGSFRMVHRTPARLQSPTSPRSLRLSQHSLTIGD